MFSQPSLSYSIMDLTQVLAPFSINNITDPIIHLKLNQPAKEIRNRHGINGYGTIGTHMLCRCQQAN